MKISLRLWLYISSVVALVLVLVWVFQIYLLPSNYISATTNRMDSHLSEIMQILDKEPIYDLSSDASRDLVKLVETQDLRIELFNTERIRSFFSGWGENLPLLNETEWDSLYNGGYLSKTVKSTGMGEILICAQAVMEHQELRGVLLLASHIAPIEDTLYVLQTQLIIVMTISFLFSTGVAFLVSRIFVKPIREMETVTRSISEGHYDMRVMKKGAGELADLAAAINTMSYQLSQVESMRQDFIATVSHQFKTPLAIIQGHTELMADMMPADVSKKFEPQLLAVLEETAKLNSMAKDILELSKIQTGSTNLSKKEISVSGFCKRIGMALTVIDENIELKFDIDENLTTWADAESLHHILQNIIQNAYCHAKARKITVKACASESGGTFFSVKDDGIGLTDVQQERIFDRFYKGDSKNRSGTGLGMAIVKSMLEAHGAQFGITVDRGTEVWFILPNK